MSGFLKFHEDEFLESDEKRTYGFGSWSKFCWIQVLVVVCDFQIFANIVRCKVVFENDTKEWINKIQIQIFASNYYKSLIIYFANNSLEIFYLIWIQDSFSHICINVVTQKINEISCKIIFHSIKMNVWINFDFVTDKIFNPVILDS